MKLITDTIRDKKIDELIDSMALEPDIQQLRFGMNGVELFSHAELKILLRATFPYLVVELDDVDTIKDRLERYFFQFRFNRVSAYLLDVILAEEYVVVGIDDKNELMIVPKKEMDYTDG